MVPTASLPLPPPLTTTGSSSSSSASSSPHITPTPSPPLSSHPVQDPFLTQSQSIPLTAAERQEGYDVTLLQSKFRGLGSVSPLPPQPTSPLPGTATTRTSPRIDGTKSPRRTSTNDEGTKIITEKDKDLDTKAGTGRRASLQLIATTTAAADAATTVEGSGIAATSRRKSMVDEEDPTSPTSTTATAPLLRKAWYLRPLALALIGLLVLAIALGLGLGIGIGTKNENNAKTTVSSSSSSSSSTATTTSPSANHTSTPTDSLTDAAVESTVQPGSFRPTDFNQPPPTTSVFPSLTSTSGVGLTTTIPPSVGSTALTPALVGGTPSNNRTSSAVPSGPTNTPIPAAKRTSIPTSSPWYHNSVELSLSSSGSSRRRMSLGGIALFVSSFLFVVAY